MALKPAFIASYTRHAVRPFFQAVPLTSLEIFVLDSFLRVKGRDEAVEVMVPERSVVNKRGL